MTDMTWYGFKSNTNKNLHSEAVTFDEKTKNNKLCTSDISSPIKSFLWGGIDKIGSCQLFIVSCNYQMDVSKWSKTSYPEVS